MDAIDKIRPGYNQIGGQQGSTPHEHLAWLGPVRMLVITLIAFGYASTMPRGASEAEYLNILGYDPSWIGISVLFMMSGFMALRSLQKHGSIVKFLTSRMGRNLPTLILSALLIICVVFPVFGAPLGTEATRGSQHFQYFLKVVTCVDPDVLTPGLLDNALYKNVIQGGLWTFRWGMIAFFATALLWGLGGMKNKWILLGLSVAILLAYMGIMFYISNVNALENPALENPSVSPLIKFTATGLRLGWAYMAGMSAYAFRKILRPSLLTVALIAVGFLIVSIVSFLLSWASFVEIIIDSAFGYMVYGAVCSTKKLPHILKALPDLSLGLYVFNWPMAQLTLLMLPTLSPLGLFAISFPLTVLIAYISWAALSRPINARL